MERKPIMDIKIEANGPAVHLQGEAGEGVEEEDGLHIYFYEIEHGVSAGDVRRGLDPRQGLFPH